MRKFFLFSIAFLIYVVTDAQKKPLDHTVYDSWQRIGERMISNDGKWVVYTIEPQEGDNELVVQSSDAQHKMTIPRGYSALITEDSRFVVFKIRPFFKDTRDARIKKKKPEDMPKDSLGIVELGKESILKIAKVKTFKAPQKSSGWVAWHLEKTPEPAKKQPESASAKRISDSLTRYIDSLKRVIMSTSPKKKKNKNKD